MTRTKSARSPLLLALFGVLLTLAPSHAAGTGGIEVTPVPAVRDGKPVTTFEAEVPHDGRVEVPYLLSNVEDGPRTATVYSARVLQSDGSFSLDDEGSSPYVTLDKQEVTLQPGEVREESFTVHPGPDGPPEGEAFAAVVVEVRNGAVVQRANTLIYLTPGRRLPLPLVLVLVAVGLVTAAAVAVVAVGRRRRASERAAIETA